MGQQVKKKIAEIAKINERTYSGKEQWSYVNYLDTGNITLNKIDEIQRIDIGKDKLPSRARRKVQKDSIVFSTVRPNQLHYGILKNVKENMLVSTGFVVLDVDRKVANPDYIFYILTQTEVIEHLQAIAEQSVSTYPSIKPSDLGNYIVNLPPLDEQSRIARILSSIDEKISTNNVINDNLQQQALVLYSELISLPLETKNGHIGDYCSVKSGFAFKSSWWTDKGIRVIKIKTIDNDALNLADCSYVSEDKVSYATDFKVNGGDLLIAMTGATIGKFAIVPKVTETLLVNQRVGKFFLGNEPLSRLPFIFCTLKQADVISEIINRGQGSAQPNISGNDIMSVSCYLPNKEVIKKFNTLCRPLFETIIENQYQNHSLTVLRDNLLPKLMSGEIDVSDVQI